jgi:Zinc carboxypeptidase/Carboxypeptidase regulatory-like domain
MRCSGRMRALALVLGLSLWSRPLDAAPGKSAVVAPSASGFPQHDPRREVTLLGKVIATETPVLAAKAKTVGGWTDAGGRLLPMFAAPASEQWWFPAGDAAHLGEGMLRVRVELHGQLDLSVLLRHRYQGEPPKVMSGYGLSIEGDSLRFHRWDRGMVLPMGPQSQLAGLDKRKSLELVVVMVGAQLFASVYDGDTLAHLATTAVHDTTYAFGCVGIRVGPKHDPAAAITLLTTMDATKHASRTHMPARTPRYGLHAAADATPFGNTRYAFVPASALAGLPKPLRGAVQARIDEPGGEQAVLFLDTVGYERLRRTGVPILAVDSNVPWKVFDAPFRAHAGKPPKRHGRGFVLDDSYKDPARVEDLLRAYHERYPKITTLVEIGRTHQRRPIWALKISDAPERSEAEPSVLLDGAHHGSELLSIEYVLDAIDRLVGGYQHDARVTKWVDGLEIWCVPLVNVDGNHMFVHESRFAIRKNARDADRDGFSDPFEGVDLNRNYPFGWGEIGSSAQPMHKWYRGPSPGSEPETMAMMALAERERFAAVLSFHTYGTDIYSSYVVPTKRDLVPDVPKAIGNELAAAAPLQPEEREYKVRKGPYPVAGSDQDWYLHEHGTIAFVVEGSHHNPGPEIRAQAIAGTRPIWESLLDRVQRGPWIGGQVRDADGKPVVAEVMIVEIRTAEGEAWTTRARDGHFERAVAKPGRYTVVVRAPGKPPIERKLEVGSRRVDVDIVIPN